MNIMDKMKQQNNEQTLGAFEYKHPTFDPNTWTKTSNKSLRNEICKKVRHVWTQQYEINKQKHSENNVWCRVYDVEWNKQWRKDAKYMTRAQYKWINDMRLGISSLQ
eukprot:303092_1